MPERKISEVNEALQAAINKIKLTKRELQRLARRLDFAARVIYGGRTFLRRLINSFHYTRMTQTLRKDLHSWIKIKDIINVITLFVNSDPLPLDQFSTDACLTGQWSWAFPSNTCFTSIGCSISHSFKRIILTTLHCTLFYFPFGVGSTECATNGWWFIQIIQLPCMRSIKVHVVVLTYTLKP